MERAVGGVGNGSCLVISANTVITPYPVFPLGAACLITALREHGFRACHFDLLADGGLTPLRQLLEKQVFDLIGISIRNLDSTDSADNRAYLEETRRVVGLIRSITKTPVVVGGAAFSIMPEVLVHYLDVDYGIVGEGEEQLPQLLADLVAKKPPEQRILTAGPAQNVWRPATLTPSAAEYYLRHGGMLNVQTKRGCPYGCSYCSYPTIEGRRVRYRDPDEVAREVNQLRDHYGARYLFFADSVFNDSEGRYLEVAEALIRHKNTLPWCAFFRPQNIRRSDLDLLKRSGLAALELGTDATTDKTLAGIGKSFSMAEVFATHAEVVDAGIPCAHYVMIGGPGEDRQSLEEGLANLEKLEQSVVFAFIGLRILPQTRLYEQAIADGVIDRDQELLEPVYYYSPQLTRDEMETAVRASFADRLDRIYPCHEYETKIAMLHQLGHVGPLWDFILKKGRERRT